jgi:sec-independent protein translocase protein TatC
MFQNLPHLRSQAAESLKMSETPEEDRELSFLEHLVELRSRLLKACLSIVVVLIALLPFSRHLYETLAAPMMAQLPEGSSMIAIDVASPFLTPFKLTLLISIMISIPVVLYQLWAFVAPALFKHEKRLARPLLLSSVFLFYAGCAFAYFVVFPLIFGFLTRVAPEGVAVMTDISKYLDFVMTLFLAFGITFEVPIATIILVATGITTPAKLASWRPYIIVGAFALGMILTPPDVISQTLLALPMWLLFEIGIIFSRILIPEKETEAETEKETDQATS